MTRRRTTDLLVLAAAVLLLGTGLGATDLWAPDEPRYGRIADEILGFEHGVPGLLLLHLNAEPYTQKPPLYFWLAALAGAPGGAVDEVAARLPSVLAGIGCVVLTLILGRRLLPSPAAAAWGAIVLLTTFRFAHQARRAQLDVLLCLFEAIAMLAFVRLEQGRGEAARNTALLHGALGLAVLTKGPVGLLPLAVAAAVRLQDGRSREVRDLFPAWALALSLGPGLLWIGAAIALAPPGFADAAVVDNLFGRFFTGTAHVRPIYYFFYQLPLDLLPWSLAAPVFAIAAHRAGVLRPSEPGPRLLWTWVAIHFVFFSLSAGKRGLYLLPAFPAIALLFGGAIEAWLAANDGVRARSRASFAVAAALGLAGGLVAAMNGVQVWRWGDFALPATFGLALLGTGIALVVADRLVHQPRPRLATGVAALLALELAMFVIVFPAFDAEKSPRPVALEAARHAGPGEPIGVFEHDALTGGIAHYSGRHVVALSGEDALRAFVERGGHSVVIRRSSFEALRGREDFVRQASLRGGPRELLVVTPRTRVSDPTQVPSRQDPDTRNAETRVPVRAGVYPTGL